MRSLWFVALLVVCISADDKAAIIAKIRKITTFLSAAQLDKVSGIDWGFGFKSFLIV
jgi:hypothetical protein